MGWICAFRPASDHGRFVGPDGKAQASQHAPGEGHEEQDGNVRDLKISGQGCSISQSSASMMSAAVNGKSVEEARELTRAFKTMMSIHEQEIGGASEADEETPEVSMGDLAALRGVVKFPVRIKCATLAWNTLLDALDRPA